MRVLGIDPGSASPSGAVYVVPTRAKGTCVDAFDIPMTGEDNERRIDVLGLVDCIQRQLITHITIERVNAMPSIPDKETGKRRVMGSASTFRFAAAFGDLRTTARLCGFEPKLVMPAVWKKACGLKGSNKEDSRLLAIELFPAIAPLLARKKDEGRAEAALIARWGANYFLHDEGLLALTG